jgi:hypothetical protein
MAAEQAGLATQVVQEVDLEPADVLDRDRVELTGGAGPDRDDLLLDRVRRALALLEQLHEAGTLGQLGARGRVEVGGEHREGLHGAELGEVELERPATSFMALICAAPPTRDTETPTSIAGRTLALNRSDCR